MTSPGIEVPGWVESELRALADPARREVTSRYFPTAMEILGVPVPALRQVVRRLHRETRADAPRSVLEMAFLLHAREVHELRQAAFELLDRRRDARALLGIRSVRRLGKGNDNWASVDAFAVLVSGQVWREGQIPDREVLRWTGSRDRWWRRTALVSTIPLNMPSRGGSGDPERTLRLCSTLADDPDPMVAKGLSWALRALIPVDSRAVDRFIEEKGEVLPALVRREVRNKLETGRKNPAR